MGDPEDEADESVAPHGSDDVVVEDLSSDDEVAWTPRTLRSEATVAIGVTSDDDSDDDADAEDSGDESTRSAAGDDEPQGSDADGDESMPSGMTESGDAETGDAETGVTDRERQPEER